MSLPNKHIHFASVLTRIFAVDEATPASISKELGYTSAFFVEAWCSGQQLPSLARVVELSNVIGWPLDELLLTWCADQAPEHTTRFMIILAQLLGLPAANDLFSGNRVVDDAIWLTKVGSPMTAGEVCVELDDVPIGSYRDNRSMALTKS